MMELSINPPVAAHANGIETELMHSVLPFLTLEHKALSASKR
jgi:hypothetical protein